MPWKGWESHESWAKNETQHRIKEPPKKFGLIRFIHMLPSNWSINSSKANRKRRLTWRKWKWQGCTSDSKKTLFLVAGYDKPIDKRCTLYFHPKVKERKAWEKQNIKIEHRNSLEVHWFSKGQSQNIWDLLTCRIYVRMSGRLDRLFSANSLELITQERRSYDLREKIENGRMHKHWNLIQAGYLTWHHMAALETAPALCQTSKVCSSAGFIF